jgi:hypothetical protein
MMQELIVIAACATSKGCLESTQAYKFYNVETYRESSRTYEKLLKTAPNWAITYIFPTIAVISRQKAVLRLDNNFSTEVSSESMTIKFDYEF